MNEFTISENLPSWIREHTKLYVKDGTRAHDWNSRPVGGQGVLSTLLLVTTGRRSGKKRAVPLVYLPALKGGYCIVASKGGSPNHPAWFENLLSSPEVEIKIKDEWLTVRARVAKGKEREELWEKMVTNGKSLADYQTKTDRLIPVVVLDPR